MHDKRDRQMAVAAFFVLASIILFLAGKELLAIPGRTQANTVPEANMSDDIIEARVVRVIGEDPAQGTQQLQLEIVSGPLRGQQAQVEQGTSEFTRDGMVYREGDHVLVTVSQNADGEPAMMVSDYVRTGAMALLSALFVGFTLLVSGWKGLRSLIGLAISFVIVMGFILPQILAGRDPVLISIVGSFVLLAVTLYLTTGWSLKSHISLLGILFSLVLIGMLSTFAVGLTRLNGSGSEDAMMLVSAGFAIDLRGLLLAGMIIGTLGVLDDVVVSQASAVMELAEANPSLGWRELYRRAMNIGNDHIAAVVNTLVMAYAGAALPMLLMFQVYPAPWSITINRMFITEEIVRTLVGSLGLVSAVPITTLIASMLRDWHAQRAWSAPPLTEPE